MTVEEAAYCMDEEIERRVTAVQAEAAPFEQFVRAKVDELTGELTDLLNEIIERRDSGHNFTEDELQAYVIDLAAVLYMVHSRLELWGVVVDRAERERKAAYARGFTGGKGGREEKAEWGTLASLEEETVAKMFARVYWLGKGQLDMGLQMLMSLKKSLGYKAEELNVFRGETTGRWQGREVG